jgi:hypothetical protein
MVEYAKEEQSEEQSEEQLLANGYRKYRGSALGCLLQQRAVHS